MSRLHNFNNTVCLFVWKTSVCFAIETIQVEELEFCWCKYKISLDSVKCSWHVYCSLMPKKCLTDFSDGCEASPYHRWFCQPCLFLIFCYFTLQQAWQKYHTKTQVNTNMLWHKSQMCICICLTKHPIETNINLNSNLRFVISLQILYQIFTTINLQSLKYKILTWSALSFCKWHWKRFITISLL